LFVAPNRPPVGFLGKYITALARARKFSVISPTSLA
jgi:hypothetical protein